MAALTIAPEVSPEVRRDLYFSDLAVSRAEIRRDALISAALIALFLLSYFRHDASFVNPGLLGFGAFTLSRVHRSQRAWSALRGSATADPDLSADPRLQAEDASARPIERLTLGVTILGAFATGLLIALIVTVDRATIIGWFK